MATDENLRPHIIPAGDIARRALAQEQERRMRALFQMPAEWHDTSRRADGLSWINRS